MNTRTIRRRADRLEQDNDSLSLRHQVRECCDEIDRLGKLATDGQAMKKLIQAARAVWEAYLNYGPIDDGRPEGDEFARSLDALMEALAEAKHATSR